MGINSGPSFTYNLYNIKDLLDLQCVCRELKSQRQKNEGSDNASNTLHLDIDCNWIANCPKIKMLQKLSTSFNVLGQMVLLSHQYVMD